MTYTPRTGARCSCKPGVHRDNCPNCEGSGMVIDFQAIHAARKARNRQPILRLLNLPPSVVEVIRTSDGHFLARAHGDVGFNHFLGRPSFHDGPGRDAMRETWRALSWHERREAVIEARSLNLKVREMLGGR